MSEAASDSGAKNSATGVRLNVEKDLSTIVLGDSRVEVSADGKTVTAYTASGIEVKAAEAKVSPKKGTKVRVSDDFNTVVLNGVTVSRAADGHLVITAPGATVVQKPAAVGALPRAKEENYDMTYSLGMVMEDGAIFAGLSPDTGKPMFAAPRDEDILMDFKAAQERAVQKSKETGKKYRVPTGRELFVIFNNRAALGDFKSSGELPFGWYWSSSAINAAAACYRFSDGNSGFDDRGSTYSVRLVRE